MPKKYDLRYSRERDAAAFDKQQNGITGPPPMYRADLLDMARSRALTSHEFRNIAAQTGLSVNTIRQALDGSAAKLETLKILASFFNVPWLQLFDVDRVLEFDAAGNLTAAKTKKSKVKK